VADFAFAERDRISGRSSERDARTGQFRWQLAAAMAAVDDPACLPVITALLEDEDSSVRLSAAYSLLGQSSPGTSDLLLQASQLDYGSEDGSSRNPEIQAALLRRMIRAFPQDPATSQAMKEAVASDSPSVRFMAMTAQLGLGTSVTASTSGP
jgi:HEAT repeat protein